MDRFTEWAAMAKQVRRLAILASRPEVLTLCGSIWEEHDEGAGFGERERAGRIKNASKPKNCQKNREARVAQGGERGGGGERKGPMLCCNLPNQMFVKQGDDRVMPPRRQGGPANNFCVCHWREVGCKKKGSCIYGGHVIKMDYDANPGQVHERGLHEEEGRKGAGRGGGACSNGFAGGEV